MIRSEFKYGFIFLLLVCFTTSCGKDTSLVSNVEDTQEKEEESSDEINYPSMKYKSEVRVSGSYGSYKIIENVSVVVDSKKITMKNNFKDFQVESKHSDRASNDVRSKIKQSGSTVYTRSSDISDSKYSKIKGLFLFVSKVKADGKTVSFDKAIPFLPKDDVSASKFLEILEEGFSFTYTYKDKSSSKNVSITTNISASEGNDDDTVDVTLDHQISSMDAPHVADFWSTAVFPKTSIYRLDKNKRRIKTMETMSELIMSQHSRGSSGYYSNSNISTQTAKTKLCKYTINGSTESYKCGE